MIRVKDGVRFRVLRPEIYRHFQDIDGLFNSLSVECWITCGTDGHGPDDPHTHGFALDLRTKNIPEGQREIMRTRLADLLGVNYTVILEVDHLHIQVRKDLWRTL